jgi:transcriptional regulator with XRE-family HTH domain
VQDIQRHIGNTIRALRNKKGWSRDVFADRSGLNRAHVGEVERGESMAISKGDPKCPWLLQNKGQQAYDFEKAWDTARDLAGVPDALFHDLRRVAVTNMIEAGFSEKEAMEISGHRTRAVFDRYHIVSERRLREMATRLEAHLKTKETKSEKAQTIT